MPNFPCFALGTFQLKVVFGEERKRERERRERNVEGLGGIQGKTAKTKKKDFVSFAFVQKSIRVLFLDSLQKERFSFLSKVKDFFIYCKKRRKSLPEKVLKNQVPIKKNGLCHLCLFYLSFSGKLFSLKRKSNFSHIFEMRKEKKKTGVL